MFKRILKNTVKPKQKTNLAHEMEESSFACEMGIVVEGWSDSDTRAALRKKYGFETLGEITREVAKKYGVENPGSQDEKLDDAKAENVNSRGASH